MDFHTHSLVEVTPLSIFATFPHQYINSMNTNPYLCPDTNVPEVVAAETPNSAPLGRDAHRAQHM